MGIRVIDGDRINVLVTEATDLARKARWLIEEIATRGLVVTPTLFGVTLSILIQLGTTTEDKK